MPPQVMGLEINAHKFTSLFDHSPGSWIGDREDPLIRFNSFISDIFLEPVS
jgi:hypothetical protein